MKNLVLVRIDERLIHGQVMTQWCRIRHFNTIMIVDDATANDAFLKQVCVMAVPKDFVPLCQTADEAAAYLLGDSDKEEILLLVKTPDTVERLVEKGVEVKELNAGGMGMRPGRVKLCRDIAATPAEQEVFKRLIAKGINVFVQRVPNDSAVQMEKLL